MSDAILCGCPPCKRILAALLCQSVRNVLHGWHHQSVDDSPSLYPSNRLTGGRGRLVKAAMPVITDVYCESTSLPIRKVLQPYLFEARVVLLGHI